MSIKPATCGFCFDQLDNGDPCSVHDGSDGTKHPMHDSCFKTILVATNSRCPLCDITVDPDSLMSWEIKKPWNEKLIDKSIAFISNSTITHIAATTLNELTRTVCRTSLAVLPQAVSLVGNIASDNAAASILITLGCGVGAGPVITGGLLAGAFIAENMISTGLENTGIPVSLSMQAVIIGLAAGEITALLQELAIISESALSAELVAGLVSGTFSLLE